MKTLKEKFGQFEMTKEQMKAVKGGGCPSQGCNAYWGCTPATYNPRTGCDTDGVQRCVKSCGEN